jgi:hypothetical protein
MSAGKTQLARALTDTTIKNLKPDPVGPYRVPDQRCKGLAVRIATDGGKTWDLSFRIKGKPAAARLSPSPLARAKRTQASPVT